VSILVNDLRRSATLYQSVFGLTPANLRCRGPRGRNNAAT